jgi:hypothetical protein
MKITILGAGGGEVTGSAYLLETASANVLVDGGFFQGARKLENYNRIPSNGGMKRLHAVVLTHAHPDHTGRSPLLTKAGYEGPIYGTSATFDLADLIPRDCAYLHKADVERENRRREERRRPLLDVLFTDTDVGRLRPLYRMRYAARDRAWRRDPNGRRRPHPRVGQRRDDDRGERTQARGRVLRRPPPARRRVPDARRGHSILKPLIPR